MEPPRPDSRPGPVARWAAADPIRAVGVVLIVVQLAWRAQIGSRGFLAIDDWVLASQAHESSPWRSGYLFDLFNNHLMPGGMLLSWLVTKWFGLAYWPYLLQMLVGQAAVDIALFRLLRRMLRPGWVVIAPLALFLFCPLTLEVASWWAVGVNMLPMQLAMVLAIGSHLSYLRTGQRRHIVGTALAVLFGLAFFEKSLLIVPLLFLLTAGLYTRGGLVRSLWDPLRRYWLAWAALAALSIGYLAVYLSRSSPGTLRQPNSAAEVVRFVRQLLGSTVLPGLVGGPWWWLHAADGTPLTATHELARWLAWGMVLAVTVVTTLARRSAGRAWLLLFGYLGVVGGLIGSTRLGGVFSLGAGLVPRYVSEVVVVAAICLGAALAGLAEPAPEDRPRRLLVAFRPRREVLTGALVVALAVYLLSAGWSSARFGDEWARKQGRDFLRTALAEVAAAPRTTVFFDRPVSEEVITGLSWPYNLQSKFFEPAPNGPRFVDATWELSMFDDAGHIRRGRVDGVGVPPGPDGINCGYLVTGTQARRIPLQADLFSWPRAVRFAYLASGYTTATFQFGAQVLQLPVGKGLHEYFFHVGAGGDHVWLSMADPGVTLCTGEITIGNPVPTT